MAGWEFSGRGFKFRDPGSESVRHSESRGPETRCPAGPLERSGRGWRSCLGPDSVSTSHGWWGRQHKGGWSPRGRRKLSWKGWAWWNITSKAMYLNIFIRIFTIITQNQHGILLFPAVSLPLWLTPHFPAVSLSLWITTTKSNRNKSINRSAPFSFSTMDSSAPTYAPRDDPSSTQHFKALTPLS